MAKASSSSVSSYQKAAKALIRAVKRSDRYCYAPYSKVRVSAGLYCSSGAIYSAVNVVNSSYCLSMCAERAVLYKAWSEGERSFLLMLIWSPQIDFITPCGACLQVLGELAPDLMIATVNNQDEFKFYPLATLIAKPFRL